MLAMDREGKQRLRARQRDRVIAFVTSHGFLDFNTADGIRRTLAEEFSSTYAGSEALYVIHAVTDITEMVTAASARG